MSDQPSLILGTAGHIDHGKSSLIKALTGTDPDRLAEEKRRGITIELGFAQLKLKNGRTMGIVDVPGHERFVRHMVAGATGVDVALLTIAADDGIMPQTIEHMAVLELLGVTNCVIALTKSDLVDEEWREFMEEEIRGRLASGPFSEAPIVAVSSRTGEGLDDLLDAIEVVAAKAEHTKASPSTRMPVDRVFTVKGIGTVVTGTLWSGAMEEGMELTILPSGQMTRVRSVQMHGKACKVAPAGNRVAVSLNGVSTDNIHPGDFLSSPDAARLSDRFDTRFTYQDPFDSGKPLATGLRVHVAHGTKEVLGRLLLMDGQESMAPHSTALAQIRLEEPLPLAYRDRFIIRSYSPTHVIGGGTVLLPHPHRRTTLKPEERTLLEALQAGDLLQALRQYLKIAALPQTEEALAEGTGLDSVTIHEPLMTLVESGEVEVLPTMPPLYARPALVKKLTSTIENALLTFHAQNPSEVGISKESLRQRTLPQADAVVFDALLSAAEAVGSATRVDGLVSHPKASAGARKLESEAAEALMNALQKAGDLPPTLEELAAALKLDVSLARKAMANLVKENRVVRISGERFYDAAAIDGFKTKLRDYFQIHPEATAADLKDVMGLTRKFAVPLLEYFDSIGFTRRTGDVRKLVG